MATWAEMKGRNKERMLEVMKTLTPAEQVVLNQLLQFEFDNRRLNTVQYKAPIKALVERAVR